MSVSLASWRRGPTAAGRDVEIVDGHRAALKAGRRRGCIEADVEGFAIGLTRCGRRCSEPERVLVAVASGRDRVVGAVEARLVERDALRGRHGGADEHAAEVDVLRRAAVGADRCAGNRDLAVVRLVDEDRPHPFRMIGERIAIVLIVGVDDLISTALKVIGRSRVVPFDHAIEVAKLGRRRRRGRRTAS